MEHEVLFQSKLGDTRYRICKNVYTGHLFKQIFAKGIGPGVWLTAMSVVYASDDALAKWVEDALSKGPGVV